MSSRDEQILDAATWPEFYQKPLTVIMLPPTSMEEADKDVDSLSDIERPQEDCMSRPQCVNCNAYLAVDGFDGLQEGMESKAANLKCGCRYCWHCSDNRGRHEGHDPNCDEPNPSAALATTSEISEPDSVSNEDSAKRPTISKEEK